MPTFSRHGRGKASLALLIWLNEIVQEKEPVWRTFGQYKAVAMHSYTVTTDETLSEMQDHAIFKCSDILAALDSIGRRIDRAILLYFALIPFRKNLILLILQ